MITVTIVAENTRDLMSQLAGFAVHTVAPVELKQPEAPQPEPVPQTAEEEPAPTPMEPEAVTTEPAPAPQESGPAETEVRALLNDVRVKKGPRAVRAILDDLGVSSFHTLPAELYPQAVEMANKALTED